MKWRKAFTNGNMGMYYISEDNKYRIDDEYVKVERRKNIALSTSRNWF